MLYKSISGIADRTVNAFKSTLPEYAACKIIQLQFKSVDSGTYLVQPLGQPNVVYQAQTDAGKDYKINDEVYVQVINGQRVILGAMSPQEKVSGFFNFYYEKIASYASGTKGPVYDQDDTEQIAFNTSVFDAQQKAGGDLIYISGNLETNPIEEWAETPIITVRIIDDVSLSEVKIAVASIDDVEGSPTDSGIHPIKYKAKIQLPKNFNFNRGVVTIIGFSNVKIWVGKSDNKPFDYT